jgi:hypothetical protein
MGIRTTVVLDEDVLERVRENAREEDVPIQIRAFDLGEISLPYPIRISEIDSIEDEERYGTRT